MEMLENFSLNNPYRFCIYLSSIVLVSSLLTEPVSINVNSLRISCLELIAIGLFAWIFDNKYYNYLLEQERHYDDETYSEQLIIKYNNFKLVLNSLYLFVGLLIIKTSL